MKREKVVLVEWDDALGSSSWKSREEAEEQQPSRCMTVGYLVGRDSGHLRIAHTVSYDAAGELNGVLTIPRGWVRRYRVLSEIIPKKRSRR